MKATQFNLNSGTFNNIFPFYILIDENLSIISFGKSLTKVLPQMKEDDSFSSIFTFKRPFIENITKNNFNDIINQLVVIESKESNTISLRGQFENYEKGYLFIGSPWFNTMDAVIEKNLTLHDFAFHDPSLDLLNVMNNLENSSKEMKELLTKINLQKNELKKANNEIHDLVLFTTQNPDPLLRIDFEGNLLKTNLVASLLLNTISYEDKNYEIQDFFKFIIHKIDLTVDRCIFEAKSNNKDYSFVCISLFKERYVNIYGRDITEQKKNQEELNKLSLVASATFFREMFN